MNAVALVLAVGGAGWEMGILAVTLLLSAFFSGSETALFTLSPADLQRFGATGGLGARSVGRLMRRPRRLLNTLLLGNMIVNIAFSATAAVLVLERQRAGQGAWGVALASLLPLLAVILFGEVTPKMLAYSVARQWSVVVAWPILLLQRVFVPVLWFLERGLVNPLTRLVAPHASSAPFITAEELSALMALSARRGILDPDAGEMLQEIIQLKDLDARDVMVPRLEMVGFDIAHDRQELIDLFRKTRLRKVPVYEGDFDHVLGVIHAKRVLMQPDGELRGMVRPVSYLPEAADLERVLHHFRSRHTQMAIVVDEYGGTAGLITLEDVLEEIVGDIRDIDEAEPSPAVRRISDREYVLSGRLLVRDWAEMFDLEPVEKRISSLGGLVTQLLGRIPQVGDVVMYRNLRFTVTALRGRRVHTLRLELLDEGGGA